MGHHVSKILINSFPMNLTFGAKPYFDWIVNILWINEYYWMKGWIKKNDRLNER